MFRLEDAESASCKNCPVICQYGTPSRTPTTWTAADVLFVHILRPTFRSALNHPLSNHHRLLCTPSYERGTPAKLGSIHIRGGNALKHCSTHAPRSTT